jgi:hypothetical protein
VAMSNSDFIFAVTPSRAMIMTVPIIYHCRPISLSRRHMISHCGRLDCAQLRWMELTEQAQEMNRCHSVVIRRPH